MQNKSNIFSYIAVFGLAFVLVAPFTVSGLESGSGYVPTADSAGTTESTSPSEGSSYTPSADGAGTTESNVTSASGYSPVADGVGTTQSSSNTGSAGGYSPVADGAGTTESSNTGSGSSSSYTPVADGAGTTETVNSGSSTVSPVTTSGSRSGGRSGGSSVVTRTASANDITINLSGEVTDTCPYIVGFILPGANNDIENVARLQTYLNEKLGLTLAVNGTYDLATQNAVKRLQTENKGAILAPWGRDIASGNVYLTTVGFINEDKCNDGSLAKAQLVAKNTATTAAPVVNGDATTVTETPASTETAPIIGSNETNTNVAAIGSNGGIFTRFFNWVKGIFGSN